MPAVSLPAAAAALPLPVLGRLMPARAAVLLLLLLLLVILLAYFVLCWIYL